jgi:hypothetical protein
MNHLAIDAPTRRCGPAKVEGSNATGTRARRRVSMAPFLKND